MLLVTKKVTPEEFVKLENKDLASDELIMEREKMVMRGMWEKRTDWENEEVKE